MAQIDEDSVVHDAQLSDPPTERFAIDQAPAPQTLRLDARPPSHRVRWLVGPATVLGLAVTILFLQAFLGNSVFTHREHAPRHFLARSHRPRQHQFVTRARTQRRPATRYRLHHAIRHRAHIANNHMTLADKSNMNVESMPAPPDTPLHSRPPTEKRTDENGAFSYLGR
jgi:hypothetical protein